jgi:lipopolysaccharide export system protein LptA
MIVRIAFIASTIFFWAFLTSLPAGRALAAEEVPLEITADQDLEWNRQEKLYIARGNAVAKQGSLSVKADTLTASYTEGNQQGGANISLLTAEGHVEILSGTSKGTGDRATYDLKTGKAILTGKNLKVVDESLTVTAQDRMEYYASEGKVVAVGSPVVKNGEDTLEADTVTAWLYQKGETPPSSAAKGNLKRAEAEGHVVITTASEKSTSDKAVYIGEKNSAELIGNVKINRGPNILEGARAEMDLTAKVSRMFGEDGKPGRVKGVFFPGSEKDDTKNEQEAP